MYRNLRKKEKTEGFKYILLLKFLSELSRRFFFLHAKKSKEFDPQFNPLMDQKVGLEKNKKKIPLNVFVMTAIWKYCFISIDNARVKNLNSRLISQ